MSTNEKTKIYKDFTFTHFKSVTDPMSIVKNAISIEEFDIIIRSDEMKKKIEQYRNETDSILKNKLKLELEPAVISGIFSKRGKKHLIQHSKFICLDVDKIPNAYQLKEELKKVDFIHYMFISPSGNGLKIIIKIDATTEEDHKQYFLALEKHFKEVLNVEIDKACKDVSRACFLSYDSAPFWNIESNTLSFEWLKKYLTIKKNTEIDKATIKSKGVESLKVTSVKISEVIQKSVQRFLDAEDKHKHPVLLSTSNYLGYYINAGYTDYTTCYNALAKAIEQRKDELNSVKQALLTIEKGLINGKENPKPIDNIKISWIFYQFWFAFDGEINIRNNSYYTFLNRHGFYGYMYNGHRKLVRVVKNIVSLVEKEDIIDFTMDYIRDLDWELGDGCTRNDLLEKYHNKLNHLTSDSQLTTFVKLKLPFLVDTADCCYLYYRNGILKITENDTVLLNYREVKGLIWDTSIIDRDYNPTKKQIDNYLEKSVFCQFIKGVTGDKEDDKQFSRFKPMRSMLGYMLHEYKDPKVPKAIIFYDEEISDTPCGGSGKGITMKSLQYFRKVTVIDGKNFSFGKTFAFQQVDLDTKVLAFDDVTMKFNFERLFSIITDGIAVEKKNKDTVYIPYKDSPKLILSTNYMITGDSNSFDRRKIEIEFSQHYNGSHTPFDEFGHNLFDEWDKEQWQYFDIFMVRSVQLFLLNGLIKPVTKNVHLRKLRQQTSEEFCVFCENKLSLLKKEGTEYPTQKMKERFIDDYEDYEHFRWFTQRTFNKWLKLYGTLFGFSVEFRYSNNVQYVSYSKKDTPQKEG
jgi:hypothetical protein